MVNPRRSSSGGGGGGQSSDNPFQTHSQPQSYSFSSLLPLLKKPHAFPLLLSLLLFLTWVSLKIQYSSSSSHLSPTSTALSWSKEDDLKANLVRLIPSHVSKDNRGWLLNPVNAALEAGVAGGALNCVAAHVGEIKPGGIRGNHRHSTCNETFVIWGARTKFRLENSKVVDKGYGEVTVNEDEIAIAASPSGTAHALVNVDPVRTTYFIGCQDSIINNNSSGYKRSALLVGCNYAHTENELHGCINDVLAMQETLKERFGFDPDHIKLLTDASDSTVKPTGANIKAALSRMIEQAEPGDLLFFHYSGHGIRIPSKHGLHHKQDEAIVPCDFNLITDMDFRALVNKLPREATFTFLSDSCHSGGLIDKEKEQIGPYSTSSDNHSAPAHNRSKNLPFESVLGHLSSVSSIDSDDIGTHLVACFGDEASLKFRQSNLALKEAEEIHPDLGILLSGCQADETSADLPAEEGGNSKACGAFSDAVQRVLKENKGPVSNREVVVKARAVLKDEAVEEQHPCLYCSDQNAYAPFLGHSREASK